MIRSKFVAQDRDAFGADSAEFFMGAVQFDIQRVKNFTHLAQRIDGAIVKRIPCLRLHLSPFVRAPGPIQSRRTPLSLTTAERSKRKIDTSQI